MFCTDCPRHDANQNTCSLFLWRFVLALRAMAYVHAEVLTIAACDGVTVSPCHLKCPCRERCETTRPHEPPNFPDALGGPRKALFGVALAEGAPRCQRPSGAFLERPRGILERGAAPPVKPGRLDARGESRTVPPDDVTAAPVSWATGGSGPSLLSPTLVPMVATGSVTPPRGYPQTCPP